MDNKKTIKYLSNIHSPNDVKKIPEKEIDFLASEIREELVRIVSQNGGHLASNLGVVELTLAIHRVFDTPKDHVIFDVGHQSYVHKMLTGRYECMETIRKAGGLSGFPKVSESAYDAFGTGHSSTSFSAALGFATADKLKGSDAYTVAIFGDGAYTGGMIHEAINNCQKDLRLIIILNENEMSISKNIGRFAKNLSKLRASSGYMKTKRVTGAFLNKIPLIGKPIFKGIRRLKMFFKNAFYGSNYFESMGLTYLGPIDGNNYGAVEKLLREAKRLNESVIIHVKTVKGKGYIPAEEEPSRYHGMPPSDVYNDKSSFSEVMGEHLTYLADSNAQICAITAAMSDGTGLNCFKEKHKERFFDVGIAEEHALTFSAGLASNGMRPCAAIYSTFLQRAYDNIVHDVALQNLPVLMLIDRAGLNLKDGATHHGIFDVAFLSHIPNIRIYTPISNEGLKSSMNEALSFNCPCAIRYPSGTENAKTVERFYKNSDFSNISFKTDFSENEKNSIDVIIITHGRIVDEAIKVSEEFSNTLHVGIILLEVLKPYNNIADSIRNFIGDNVKTVLFYEEEIKNGGMGMNLSTILATEFNSRGIKQGILAIDDNFAAISKEGQNAYQMAGVDYLSAKNEILRIMNNV
ncbi:MAG: 1-deoxy-D-xylulose-5-phosphate synthase [Ruminococcaceae bacterium]|nr:1-deoxy-D-xylulose-5-phosphate synthase [Oscillospiraceae bacterium]